MLSTPSLFDPPARPPVDPDRVRRYLAVCAQHSEDPGHLVRFVTAPRPRLRSTHVSAPGTEYCARRAQPRQ